MESIWDSNPKHNGHSFHFHIGKPFTCTVLLVGLNRWLQITVKIRIPIMGFKFALQKKAKIFSLCILPTPFIIINHLIWFRWWTGSEFLIDYPWRRDTRIKSIEINSWYIQSLKHLPQLLKRTLINNYSKFIRKPISSVVIFTLLKVLWRMA